MDSKNQGIFQALLFKQSIDSQHMSFATRIFMTVHTYTVATSHILASLLCQSGLDNKETYHHSVSTIVLENIWGTQSIIRTQGRWCTVGQATLGSVAVLDSEL